jgi:hypothetical protein
MYKYIKSKTVAIQTAAYWNPIGCSMTPPTAQQYSFAIFVLSRLQSYKKNTARI